MAPVLVVWAPEVPPGLPLVRMLWLPQSVVLSTLALYHLGTHFTAGCMCWGGGGGGGWCDGRDTCTGGDRSHNH